MQLSKISCGLKPSHYLAARGRLFCLLALTAVSAWAARGEIVSPRCEGASNPVGVACARPRFTWALAGEDPKPVPCGAELRLAANRGDLAAGRAPLWTKQTDGACFEALYDGPTLRAGVPYWWQVRLVAKGGSAVTAWCEPQRFMLALQTADAWEGARWVGEAPVAVAWRDFDYTVKFTLVREAFGVWFRARDAGTGYMWQINAVKPDRPLLRPHLFQNGTAHFLPTVELTPYFPKGLDWKNAHVLRVETRGERIRTFLDGVCVDTRTDATFVQGTVGVRTSAHEEARVASVLVTDPQGRELMEDSFRGGHRQPVFRRATMENRELVLRGASHVYPGVLPKNTVIVRKRFGVAAKPIACAVASACGFGFYELRLNGVSVDPSRAMAPGMTGRGCALFDTYDVTDRIRSGAQNEVAFELAPGYSDDFSRYGWHWLAPKQAILHLAVTYADGTREVVKTDASWERASQTPIPETSIYHGETIDARLRDATPAYEPVRVYGDRTLLAHDGPPIRRFDPRPPIRITEPKPGVFVADFGQNRAGVVEVRVKGPRGTAIRLHTSELLGEDGMIDPWSNTTAKSTDTFILAGTGAVETFCPRFTYHGFQFVEITGWPGRPEPEDLVGWAVGADVETAGTFACSDPTLTKYMNAAYWSMRSNFMSYPTDCCMRGERTPCQMDSQAYEDAALQYFNLARYYAKWLDDIAGGRGNPDWTGDSVTLPWRLYRETGDGRILAAHYADMKAQVENDLAQAPDLIWTKGFGDWCAPNKGTWESYFNDVEIVNSSILCEMIRIVAETAAVLGHADDARHFQSVYGRARAAFQAKFFHADSNTYGDGSQTTSVLPLAFDLVPAERRSAVAAQLVRTIREKNGGKVDAGIFGTRYLGDVLADAGAADDFVHLMTQPEAPGFGYMFARGATSLWEQWTYRGGMNTHNHAMYSGAASSLMTRLAGIRAVRPGFAEIEIRPSFPKTLEWVKASRETVRGRVAVSWRRQGSGKIELTVELPPLTPTRLVLPGQNRPIDVPCGVSTHVAF